MNLHDPIDAELRPLLRRLSPRSPCPPEARWLALVAGELAADEAEALRGHLAECASCAAIAAEAHRFQLAFASPGAAPGPRRIVRWALAAAALVTIGAGLWLLRGGAPGATPDRVGELAAGLEVAPPPAATPADGAVYRGTSEGAAGALADALLPYRARRWPEACRTLAELASRSPENREARYLAAVACLKAGELDRSEALLASLAAVGGDRRDDARALLDRLRSARRTEPR